MAEETDVRCRLNVPPRIERASKPETASTGRSINMKHRWSWVAFGAALALTFTFQASGKADDKDKDKKAPSEAFVQFGQFVSAAPAVGSLEATLTHFLFPDDLTIRKGGTVTFIVNGGGHGIAIHRVSRKTTRTDIAEDLCQGGTNEADRAGRFLVCNGTIVTGVDAIVGTQNLAYQITDGKDDLVIDAPQNVGNNNPRLDDPNNSERLLATSGRSKPCGAGETAPACDPTAPGANPAGGFLTGSAPPATPGNRIRVTFNKSGRYLVICMNRAHSLNDHMFGFVNVGDDDDDN
jgi:plastocyanin